MWAREIAGQTQAELAKAIGVDPSTLNKHEAGSRAPSVFTILRLSEALAVSTDYLLRGRLDGRCDYGVSLKLAALHPELVIGAVEPVTGNPADRFQEDAAPCGPTG